MKHPNYRLLACFLSFWMLLGALAQPVSALALSDTNGYGTYSATGDVTTQGPMPEDIVRIELPTVRSNVFDVKVDPNNIIRQLGAENFQVNGQTPRIGAGKVFFTNIDSDSGEVSFTCNSDRLNIINKGNVPLTVKMSVSVDKGDNEFTFANSPSFTDNVGKPISGPALYLALTTGPIRTPVLPIMTKDETTGVETLSGYGATATGWIADNRDAYYIAGNRSTGQYYYARNTDFPDEDFSSTTFYMTGAINDEGWNDRMGNFSLTVTWNVSSVTYEKGPDTNPSDARDIRPWADTLFAAAKYNDEADLYVNYGSGEFKMNKITGIAYLSAGGSVVTVSAAQANMTIEGSYVSIPSTSALYNGSQWMLIMTGEKTNLRVPFSLKDTSTVIPEAQENGDVSPGVKVTKAATAQNAWAELDVTLGPLTKVVSLSYVMSNGEEGIASNAQVFEVNGTSVRVKAFLGAWTGSDWRLNLEDDNGATASVYFNLKQEGEIKQPVIITTKKATAQNEFAVLKVYMNNMTEITGLKYRMSNKIYGSVPHTTTQIFPEVALPEVQVKAFLGVWTGDRPSLEFKDDSGQTFSARFAIVYS